MNTQYFTFILRLRMDERQSQERSELKVFGSVQQVGLQEIHYFDSVEKFQDTLQQLVGRVNPSVQEHKDDLQKSST